jgi:hypothetical protein
MPEFTQSLSVGHIIENDVLQIIRRKYPCAVRLENKFSGYDIFIPEIEKRIEVKSDQKSQYTGNILIEFEMNGRASGIMTTKADFWVFFDGEQYRVIEPRHIIDCIFKSRQVYHEITGNGDTKTKKAFLIRKNELFKYGKELK